LFERWSNKRADCSLCQAVRARQSIQCQSSSMTFSQDGQLGGMLADL
jgi:hypothetical protein